MNTDCERWTIALEGVRHLRQQARMALNDLHRSADRDDTEWRRRWSFWQNELLELRACETDARRALAALQEQHQQAA